MLHFPMCPVRDKWISSNIWQEIEPQIWNLGKEREGMTTSWLVSWILLTLTATLMQLWSACSPLSWGPAVSASHLHVPVPVLPCPNVFSKGPVSLASFHLASLPTTPPFPTALLLCPSDFSPWRPLAFFNLIHKISVCPFLSRGNFPLPEAFVGWVHLLWLSSECLSSGPKKYQHKAWCAKGLL